MVGPYPSQGIGEREGDVQRIHRSGDQTMDDSR